MEEIAIEVKDVHVFYDSVKGFSIQRLFSRGKMKTEKIHAVRGVSFEVKTGEILGIIGKNGSGKSTLLRTIAGVFGADLGYVDLKGNKVSLCSIGVGFNPELSGRKNVYLSGMLLGYKKEEIDSRIDEVIEFSELGEFIDKPVRTYSSGMYSKLAFSTVVNLETDILLLDEVLSVGDEKFSVKSFEKMKELIQDRDRTVVMVSHSLAHLRQLCTSIMWINDGKVMEIGEPNYIIDKYLESC